MCILELHDSFFVLINCKVPVRIDHTSKNYTSCSCQECYFDQIWILVSQSCPLALIPVTSSTTSSPTSTTERQRKGRRCGVLCACPVLMTSSCGTKMVNQLWTMKTVVMVITVSILSSIYNTYIFRSITSFLLVNDLARYN